MNSAMIEMINITKKFGNSVVLKDLSFFVPEGKITFIIGKSGEGKSVTLKHLVGLLKPDSGKIIIHNEDMTTADVEEWNMMRTKMGILFQDGALFDSLSVYENVVFPLREHAHYSEDQLLTIVKDLLILVDLPGKEEEFPSQLSIGEKKRVGLARALALQPMILLYDEPTTSMDTFISNLIDTLIINMQKNLKKLTTVVVSHDLHSIFNVADHIVFIHKGCCYLQGSPQVFKSTTDPLVQQFLAGESTVKKN